MLVAVSHYGIAANFAVPLRQRYGALPVLLRAKVQSPFISLDSVVEAPDQWPFPYFNDDMGAAVDATLGSADIVLLGHKTYDTFAGA